MNYAVLKAEITDDPLGRGYVGMADQQIAESLNTVNRDQNKARMSGSEILNSVASADWVTRTDDQKQVIWDIVHLGTVNPFGVEATLMIEAFTGSTGATITALQSARKTLVSRAAELGLGKVRTGHVQRVGG